MSLHPKIAQYISSLDIARKNLRELILLRLQVVTEVVNEKMLTNYKPGDLCDTSIFCAYSPTECCVFPFETEKCLFCGNDFGGGKE